MRDLHVAVITKVSFVPFGYIPSLLCDNVEIGIIFDVVSLHY